MALWEKQCSFPTNGFPDLETAIHHWSRRGEKDVWECRIVGYKHSMNPKNQRWLLECEADRVACDLQRDDLPQYEVNFSLGIPRSLSSQEPQARRCCCRADVYHWHTPSEGEERVQDSCGQERAKV